MPIKMAGRYERGSDHERAHKLLTDNDIAVSHVYGVDHSDSGAEEITFVVDGRAQTAFVEEGRIVHVVDGWDVLPPKSGNTWRGGY